MLNVLNDKEAEKQMDKSSFTKFTTGIPINARAFFEIEDFEPGRTEPVILKFDGDEYIAALQRIRSRSKITRLVWRQDLCDVFAELFPDAVETGNYPKMFIRKIDSRHYELSFDGSVHRFHAGLETVISKSDGTKDYYTTRYELDPKLISRALTIHGTTCSICGFDFEKAYGSSGKGIIEIHHIVPLTSRNANVDVDPKTDLICVCSNCHRMIHSRRGAIISPDELKEMVQKSN